MHAQWDKRSRLGLGVGSDRQREWERRAEGRALVLWVLLAFQRFSVFLLNILEMFRNPMIVQWHVRASSLQLLLPLCPSRCCYCCCQGIFRFQAVRQGELPNVVCHFKAVPWVTSELELWSSSSSRGWVSRSNNKVKMKWLGTNDKAGIYMRWVGENGRARVRARTHTVVLYVLVPFGKQWSMA